MTIDDDVLEAVKSRAHHEGCTAGEVLSDLARQSLTRPADVHETTPRNGFPVLARTNTTVTSEVVEHLRDEEHV